MLAMSDTSIELFLPVFAKRGIPVAFLVPTPTGYEKSIMDATYPVRELLRNAGLHDYALQGQGQENKVMIPAHFVTGDGLIDSYASLYRPVTKQGDPRIWFSKLTRYCKPKNLLALVIISREIYVYNLSNPAVAFSLCQNGFASETLYVAEIEEKSVSMELLGKIQEIHNRGFLPSVTRGDPGVGDTLENALGISRNNSKNPDYKGIELKSTRLNRGGVKRATTRTNLFTKVPDVGLTYHAILDRYGKWQIPNGQDTERFQLYDTCKASRANAYGLFLNVETDKDMLHLMHERDGKASAWYIHGLQETLLTKHPETFWVQASSEYQDGLEYFRYDKILHTKNPNASLIGPLLETDKITVDLAAHIRPDGSYRDHGVLFKIQPRDIPLLFGEPVLYEL